MAAPKFRMPHEVTEVLLQMNFGASPTPLQLGAALKVILSEPRAFERALMLSTVLSVASVRLLTSDHAVAAIKVALSMDKCNPRNVKELNLDRRLICVAGSGKKGLKTMNVSTPATLVAASVGGYFLKLGSIATSSVAGSADFLLAAGANVNLSLPDVEKILRRTGFAFYRIENALPRFDAAYGGLMHLPHLLSFGLPALVSPFAFDDLLYGLSHPRVDIALEVFRRFGVESAVSVTSTNDNLHFVDELGVFGVTKLVGMQNGRIGPLRELSLAEINLRKYEPRFLGPAASIRENVDLAIAVLKGKGERAREDMICINAGHLLYLARAAEDWRDGYSLAKRQIRTGMPFEKLCEFVLATGGRPKKLGLNGRPSRIKSSKQ